MLKLRKSTKARGQELELKWSLAGVDSPLRFTSAELNVNAFSPLIWLHGLGEKTEFGFDTANLKSYLESNATEFGSRIGRKRGGHSEI